MPRARFLDRSVNILGQRVPAPVALLIGLTLFASVAGAVSMRSGAAFVVERGALIPQAVLLGQLWRIASWVLLDFEPLSLIFAMFALFLFGVDLARVWGPRGLLLRYFGIAAAAGFVTCLASLAWPSLRLRVFAGPWPVINALTIAWAMLFPERPVALMFVFPFRGRQLVYAVVGGTVLFALLGGADPFVPHFAAELLTLALLRRSPLHELWARLRYEWHYRRWRVRASRLKAVPPPPRDPPTRWLH